MMFNLGKIVVVDLECACWEHRPPGEIIEVGVCLLTIPELEISKPRRIFMRPDHDTISDFCTGLTGITQGLLDEKGKDASEVRDILRTEYKIDERVWVGWGDDGYVLNDAIVGWFDMRKYMNLCSLFSVIFGSPNRVGLDRALEMLGLEFKGVRHTGGDDAFNTARVLKRMCELLRSNARVMDERDV